MIIAFLFLLFVNIGIYHASNHILEVDDRYSSVYFCCCCCFFFKIAMNFSFFKYKRIIDYSKQGKWIVSFYAPW
jgi:hypothetical protein